MIIYYILEKVHFFCAKIKKIVDNRKNIVYHTIQAHKKCAPSPTFHTFNLFMEGDFLERGKPMSKLRGYRVMLGLTQQQMADKLKISLQSYNNKELGKTPFNDKERLAIKSMVAEIKSDITIDELFYS